MTDQETNLHPKNNPSVNLKPNIVTGNIPDKSVSFKQLDENLQNKIGSQSFQIAKNAADIAKNTEDITKNTADITKNTADISKNTADISSLETRTKNLEDTKVNVNTGEFDPTSNDPASQKSVYNMPIQFENIVDSHGNKRFVEDNITMNTIEGVTQKYGKWSLSGSHLMVVFAGELSAGYTLPSIIASNIVLPSWIKNKIIHIAGDVVSYSQMIIAKKATSGGNPTIDNVNASLLNWVTRYGIIVTQQSAKDYDQVFRIQFDLLIDSE